MYPLLACDLEGCINDAKCTFVLILETLFNVFILKKLFAAHKDHIKLSRTISYKTKQ